MVEKEETILLEDICNQTMFIELIGCMWFCCQAQRHVMKYCRPELRGKESIVCSGHLTIHCEDQID